MQKLEMFYSGENKCEKKDTFKWGEDVSNSFKKISFCIYVLKLY